MFLAKKKLDKTFTNANATTPKPKNIKALDVNLTSSKLFDSNNYQIFPGDIIIVNANNARVKNAGIIGNSGTLISLLSFILTSIILINN